MSEVNTNHIELDKIQAPAEQEQPFKRMRYPDDKEAILGILEQASKDKQICYRSLGNEFDTGVLVFDNTGRPSVPCGELPAPAFHNGGWDKVFEIADEVGDLHSLVSESEGGSVESPLIWTSKDLPYIATTYVLKGEEDMVIGVIKPAKREKFFITEDEDEVDVINTSFLKALKNKKDFIVLETQNPGVGGGSETLLGPRIRADELQALIGVGKKDLDSFYADIQHLYPDFKHYLRSSDPASLLFGSGIKGLNEKKLH